MLSDILTDLATLIGETSADEDRSARIYAINKAAEEIHELYDLEEGRKEKVFVFDIDDSPQIALPPYVFQVRGMRFHDSRIPITQEAARNRYHFAWFGENEIWYLKFRKLSDSCLSRNIQNQSSLKISVPLDETAVFNVTVTGSNQNSHRISETLQFAPGDLEKTTTLNFEDVESITKDIITTYNVIIKDIEDNTLGMILNSEYQSSYKIYQIGDTDGWTINESGSSVEIWYKYKLQPFKNDTDCFLGTSRYDKAIVWKFLEHRSKNREDVLGYFTKCDQAIITAIEDTEASERRSMNFMPQKFFDIYQYASTQRYY